MRTFVKTTLFAVLMLAASVFAQSEPTGTVGFNLFYDTCDASDACGEGFAASLGFGGLGEDAVIAPSTPLPAPSTRCSIAILAPWYGFPPPPVPLPSTITFSIVKPTELEARAWGEGFGVAMQFGGLVPIGEVQPAPVDNGDGTWTITITTPFDPGILVEPG